MGVAQPTHERIRGNMPRLHLNLNRMIKDRGQGERLRRALENLRKQYQWGTYPMMNAAGSGGSS